MASLATVYNRILGAKVAPEAESPAAVVDPADSLRAIPNEEIYLFVKDIDNSRVIRQADPKARVDCWRMIVSGGIAVTFLVGMLLPGAASRIAGYQIQSLKQDQQKLLNDKAALELEEARLLSPARLEELARRQQFIDPAPQKVIYLDAKPGAMALNVKK